MPIYIALGANMSNPKATFLQAFEVLRAQKVAIVKISGLWQSPAWPPGSDQPDYINAAAEVDFAGAAQELLAILHAVEAEFGRVRMVRNAPRTLDLDLLDFRGQIITDTNISIPHPRMLTRAFVLFPLQDVAPDWQDPVSGHSLMYYIARLPLADVAPVIRIGPLV